MSAAGRIRRMSTTSTRFGAAAALLAVLLAGLVAGGASARIGPAVACTDSWRIGVSGDFFTGGNWSRGVAPGPSDDACITTTGSYTVTLNGTANVRSLQLGGGKARPTLAIASTSSANSTLNASAATNSIVTAGLGTIDLTSTSGANFALLQGPDIENGGAIVSDPGTGGARFIRGGLVNTGIVTFNVSTSYDLASNEFYRNEGTTTLANGATVVMPRVQFVNATGGALNRDGSGQLVLTTNSFYDANGGSYGGTGTAPILLDGGFLNINDPAGFTADLRGLVSLFGNVSAGQTLTVDSISGQSATLALANDTTNAGTIVASSSSGALQAVIEIGNNRTLTNANGGTLSFAAGTGGERYLLGNLVNDGVVTVDTTTTDYVQGASFTNAAGSALNHNGNGQLILANSTYNADGGSYGGTGSSPILIDDGGLNIHDPAGFTADLRGTVNLTGNVSAAQTLNLNATSSETMTFNVPTGTTNAGSITASSVSGTRDVDIQIAGNGTLANAAGGTLAFHAGTGGTRRFRGSLVNDGTVTVDTSTSYDAPGVTYTNNGTTTIADGATLTAAGNTFTNASGGSIDRDGSGQLALAGSTYDANGGSYGGSGAAPILIDNGALNIDDPAAFAADLRGTVNLTGNVSAAQTLTLNATSGENMTLDVPDGTSNAGAIVSTSLSGTNDVDVQVAGNGTLTNAGGGILTFAPGTGGARYLRGSLANDGTVAVNTSTAYDAAGATYANNGTTTIGNGATLSAAGNTFRNASGGALDRNGSGQLQLANSTYDADGGSYGGSGAAPILVDNGALNIASTAPFAADLRGTVTEAGSIAKGQTLTLNATAGEDMTLQPVASLTNSGTLSLTAVSGTNDVLIDLAGKKLANAGALNVLAGTGGGRYLHGDLVNQKAMSIDPAVTLQLNGAASAFSQTSKGTLQTSFDLAGDRGQIVATGSIALAGSLKIVRPKTFNPAGGSSYTLLTGTSESGAFAKESGAVIKSPKYFLPTVSGGVVSLTVAEATLDLTPSSGPPGASVAATGDSWPPNDKVTLTFKAANGKTTTLGTPTTDGSGALSTTVTIPADAVPGKAKLTGKSTFAGVTVAKTFTVS
jgi:hypothetical protein